LIAQKLCDSFKGYKEVEIINQIYNKFNRLSQDLYNTKRIENALGRDVMASFDVRTAKTHARTIEAVSTISAGTSVTINELANIMLKIMDRKLKPVHTAPRPGDIRHSHASIERAKRIGYSPTISLEDGIKELIRSNASL
jgi:nucleoside-diphosphate-sugar epimerase